MTPHLSVLVVVVHYGPAELTVRCVEALSGTWWPSDRLDVVVVDNGGDAELPSRLAAVAPRARVLGDGRNVGFAAGCNLALRDLGGVDRVALVNPDVVVPPGWLDGLERAFTSRDVGASCPKILLAGRYQELSLDTVAKRRRPLDPRLLGVRLLDVMDDNGDALAHRLVTGFYGREGGACGEETYQWTAGRAQLWLRIPETVVPDGLRTVCVRLAADEPTAVTFRSGLEETAAVVGPGSTVLPVSIGALPTDVVNNVGNAVLPDGSGADRGYLEADDGRYEHAEAIEAWCGATVLIRADYLRDVGLFDERFFMYYEDLDLARRGARRGWRYELVPSVVVRHEHSAIAVEGSALADHYKERNRMLFAVRHLPPTIVARMVFGYLTATLSYARRDLVSPVLQRSRPSLVVVERRVRSLLSFCRLAPAMFLARRGVS